MDSVFPVGHVEAIQVSVGEHCALRTISIISPIIRENLKDFESEIQVLQSEGTIHSTSTLLVSEDLTLF
jgi:hypothetical protein